jgi:hypothetical protein
MWLLLRTDVPEELCASIIRVTRIGELGTTLATTSNRRMLRYIPEDGIFHCEVVISSAPIPQKSV